MRMMTAAAMALVAGLLLVVGAGAADAAPGRYTKHGNVYVEVQVYGPGCATVTWPKGNSYQECYSDSTVQEDITPGDRFGAKIRSRAANTRVSCEVTDLETGDLVYSDYASEFGVADCLRKAR